MIAAIGGLAVGLMLTAFLALDFVRNDLRVFRIPTTKPPVTHDGISRHPTSEEIR